MEKSPRVAAALLALAGASGCVATFDYPLGDLSEPQDAAADTAADASAEAADSGADVSVDAGPDADASVDVSVEADAPTDVAADADAPIDASDAGATDAPADAAQDAPTDADAGVSTPGLGVLGQACGQPGDLACAGHAKKITLLCDGTGHWAASVTCPNGELCDSRAGLNRGTCAAIDPVCSASQPGDIVCDGQRRTQCGPDLVSSIVLETCVSQACTPAACVGACAPGATRCSGDGVQSCSAAGQWGAPAACPSTAPSCSGAVCGQPPSCVGGAGGQADCGPGGNESCCTSPLVPGGTFSRSYDGVSAGYTDPQYRATVSDFRLDKYEITVGRFRQFVAAWDAGWRPAQGDGKHSHLNGGSGLTTGGGADASASFEKGWESAWSASLATTKAGWDSNLLSDPTYKTWTPSAGANDRRPIIAETWYEALAFCVWDGGFLPSEAEWNYAASGGSEQRVYPWSVPSTSTVIDSSYASYNVDAVKQCFGDGVNGCSSSDLINAGSKPAGNGKWGHAELGGNVFEWVVDQYTSLYGANSCINCVSVAVGSTPVFRGGQFNYGPASALASARGAGVPASVRSAAAGARCARSAP